MAAAHRRRGGIDALADFLDERLSPTSPAAATIAPCCWNALLAQRDQCDLLHSMDAAGTPMVPLARPHVAAGPGSIVKADVVGNGHLRIIAAAKTDAGQGDRFEWQTPLGEALLAAPRTASCGSRAALSATIKMAAKRPSFTRYAAWADADPHPQAPKSRPRCSAPSSIV